MIPLLIMINMPILHTRNWKLRREFSKDNMANEQTRNLTLNSFISKVLIESDTTMLGR